ncbi:phosphatase PAP2 family protein [Devosia sediminis]|uniref:Phosphatase PAP2 family protein n=1 Tax=Devosia sediminis TaxID=2798801 RepID=A0A934J0T2_9HYPH|nr:phosphatase PAP2 family protein [Devosia sediminis]MBJ3786178.1 phosphatase PAP2 family protein [Devosia sediminis]
MAGQFRIGALPLAVLTYAALAFAVSPDTYGTMLQLYLRQATILPILLLVGIPAAALVLQPKSPIAMIFDILRGGALRLGVVMAIFCLGTAAFTTFKLAIPDLVPFYADAFLAKADAWLHGGDPGNFAHAIVPAWAQYPLAYLYGPIWFVLWFGLLAFIALHRDAALRRRYFWSMSLTMGLIGTVAATAFSSVGPIFYDEFVDPNRFIGLMDKIRGTAIGDYMAQASAYLLTSYETGAHAMGTGISAMPSMHLAIVTLNACMLSGLNRYVGILAWLYVGVIQIGSVYLGWHYALDGYFSIAAVSLIWWAVGRLARRSATLPQAAPVAA